MPSSSATPPLVARSNDGSLVGIHHSPSSSNGNNNNKKSGGGLIRCYDGSISNGSLKFTLRVPSSSSSDGDADAIETKEEASLNKMVFASDPKNNGPSHLCGMLPSSAAESESTSASVLVWDLDRGVLSQTINVRASSAKTTTTASAGKKKRRSSIGIEGKEVLADIATAGDQLYALVFFPNAEGSGGKCRVYQYDLSADGGDASLVKKIKVGSVPSTDDESDIAGPVFGIAISNAKSMVVRMGNHVRVLDLTSGEKLCKMDIPGEVASCASGGGGEEEGASFAPLGITSDGRYIVSRVNDSQAVVLSCAKDKLQALAVLSAKDANSPISHLDMTSANDGEELTVLAFQPSSRTASLFNVASSATETDAASLVPQAARARLQSDESALLAADFHPRDPASSVLLLFQRARSKSGSASGSGTNLPMESLEYPDLEGTVAVGASLLSNDNGKDKKKRKAGDSIALAPGDQGREASQAEDLTAKKAKSAEDEDELQDMEEGEQGQSIAERLALLSSTMEQTDDEDESGDDDDDKAEPVAAPRTSFKTKMATTESLTTLLTQALASNDSAQLNIALQVTDRRLVEATVRSLQSLDAQRRATQPTNFNREGYTSALMAHLVRRMARKHSLVMPLGVWVRAILAATARSYTADASVSAAVQEQMKREGRELALKLGPLKSFLNERVESFPMLLRLEGRLALLGSQQQL